MQREFGGRQSDLDAARQGYETVRQGFEAAQGDRSVPCPAPDDEGTDPGVVRLPSFQLFSPRSGNPEGQASAGRAGVGREGEAGAGTGADCNGKAGFGGKRGEKRRRKGKAIAAVAILLVALAALGLGAAAVLPVLRGEGEPGYYYVAEGGYTRRAAARARAEAVANGGGAGFLLSDGQQFWVVLAAYPTRAEGEAVAAKNPGTQLLARTLCRPQRDWDAEAGRAAEAYLTAQREALATLYQVTLDFATGGALPSDATAQLEGARAALLAAKEEVVASGALSAQQKRTLLPLSDPLLGGWESLPGALGGARALATLRYLYVAGATAITDP